jgi:hypothetical protein
MSLADVLLGGEGFIITAHPTSVKKDESSVSKVKNMDAMTDRLKFLIRDSKHDLHYKTLHSLSTGLDTFRRRPKTRRAPRSTTSTASTMASATAPPRRAMTLTALGTRR